MSTGTIIAEAKRKRGHAKGTLTRITPVVEGWKKAAPQDLVVRQLQVKIDELRRAEETFRQQTEILLGEIPEEEEDTRAVELKGEADFQVNLQGQLDSLTFLMEQCTAFQNLDDFEEELEEAEKELPDHVGQLKRRLPSLHKGLEEILKVLSKPGAKKLPELRKKRSILRTRVLALDDVANPSVSTKGSDKLTDGDSSVDSTSHDRSSRLKMPSIEMPQFSGQMLDWERFWQDFSAALSHDTKLTDSEKAIYLSTAIKSKEARAIIATPYERRDYKEMVKALQDEYDQPREIYRTRVKKYLNHTSIGRTQKSLKEARTDIMSNIKSLEKYEHSSLEAFLIAGLELSFSDELFKEWKADLRHLKSKTPTLQDMERFFKDQLQLIDSATPTKNVNRMTPSGNQSSNSYSSSKKIKPVLLSHTRRSCVHCKQDHSLNQCDSFKTLPVEDRSELVKSHQLCLNCLTVGHRAFECCSKYSCRHCGARHHTLLHRKKQPVVTTTTAEKEKEKEKGTPEVVQVNVSRTLKTEDTALSPTCQVLVEGPHGTVKARAFIDGGSHVSLATHRLANQLKLAKTRRLTRFSGLTGTVIADSTHTATLRLISPDDPDKVLPLTVSLLQSIIPDTPPIDASAVRNNPSFSKLPLADPDFDKGGHVDLLLGIGVRPWIYLSGRVTSNDDTLAAYQTVYGWTVEGSLPSKCKTNSVQSLHIVSSCVEPDISRFWEMEELPSVSKLSPDEEKAVTHFAQTHTRLPDGRYQVSLPKKDGDTTLGCSRELAVKRYLSNERSLQRKGVWDTYQQGILEYFTLGHAEPVPKKDLCKPENICFYMPMHGVHKVSSTTTKLRVVCDASALTTNGRSLNDILLPGPCYYPLITDVLLRFRRHRVALSGDISKMFREVSLAEEDRDLHRFVWRPVPGEELQEGRMCRVTFGVNCSPFLATQVLHQVAQDYQQEYPQAAQTIMQDFYVDDCLSGADTEEEAITLRKELNELLSQAHFTLRKWRSNSSNVLASVPVDLREQEVVQVLPSSNHKALGIHWDTAQDTFYIAVPTTSSAAGNITKRVVSSELGQLHDLMGFFTPTVVLAKLFLQKLWQCQLGWDDPLPEDLSLEWQQWRDELPSLNQHPIDRCMYTPGKEVQDKEVHGFSDASETAYACCIYLRVLYVDATTSSTLIFAKSKVAPLKPLTIPKLELCGVHLLSKTLLYVCSILHLDVTQAFAWTDSTIVLKWLQVPPRKLQTFVANRVSQAIEILPPSRWRHVRSKDNPADLASRGVLPSILLNSSLWWSGPPWLLLSPHLWPEEKLPLHFMDLPELKKRLVLVNIPEFNLDKRYNSFYRLLRITAWVLRFCCKISKNKDHVVTLSYLTVDELLQAELRLLSLHQQKHFGIEMELLKKCSPVQSQSSLRHLNPVLDESGILKVGGRLSNSKWTESVKHPPIIYGPSHFGRLVVTHLHQRHQHAGPTLLISMVAAEYYITSVRRVIRDVTRACVTCKKVEAQAAKQIMGQLPTSRITPSPPFSNVGIDFAGPLQVRLGRVRKSVSVKAFVAVFVCMCTRALHLEAVTDLSTEAFLAAFKRFIARRGLLHQVFSDNGTNFVGADKEIQGAYQLLQDGNSEIAGTLAAQKIRWSRIPSRSPNFGGIWETGVKSMKNLLKKTMGATTFTFEELATVLAQTEAILNSRPLLPIETLPEDGMEILTPAHFLVGRPLTSLPPMDTSTGKTSSIRRWNLMQRHVDELWERWSGEYLQSLNRYSKWIKPQKNLQIGDIVLCKDLPEVRPRAWPLARVSNTFPGNDGIVRVVELSTGKKTYVRSVRKVVPLLSCPPQDGPATAKDKEAQESVKGSLQLMES